jgi:hypothetical protein
VLGDEELLEGLLAGARDTQAIVWEIEDDAATGPGSGEIALATQTFLRLWQREGLPAVRVRLPALDAASLGGAVLLSGHAAVTAALFLDQDPLALDAVAAWYAAMDHAREDVDADGGNA